MNKENVDSEEEIAFGTEETIDVIMQDEHDDLLDSNGVLVGVTSGNWK